MDHGTNAIDILSGRVYPLKLGFVGVVNRSQQDINGMKPLEDALQAERDFFKHHPAYRNMAARCGTQFLAKTLNTTLKGHIRERLPDIKARLNTLMGQTQQELASYGDVAFTGVNNRGSLVLQLMTRFASSFISSIDGTSSEISTKELGGGARIYYIFNSVFGNSLETIDPNMNLSILDIRTAIRNSTGPRPSLFVPELAFDLLVKPQIKLLDVPSQRCVELVYEELIKICHTCGSNELSRYPRLQAKLIEVVSNLLRERLGPTSGYVESLISIQRAYINTNHPNFLGAAAAMSSVMNDRQEKEKKVAAAAAERLKREKRVQANGINGHDLDDVDDVQAPATSAGRLAVREKPGRSQSPAMHRGSMSGASGMQGLTRGQSPPHFPGQQGPKDSFLNYFFGKDGSLPGGAPGTLPLQSSQQLPGARHVSQNAEPSFAASLRRGDPRAPDRTIMESMRDSMMDEQDNLSLDGPLMVSRAIETTSRSSLTSS
jgi:dynamin 1-like protein